MHKKFLVLLTGSIALSISAVPVLASDPPTDDGQYIWQDKNGDYWYRNGSEDEYIGEPLILAPEINIILMTTAIFRNIPIQKLIPPPGILQKNTLNQKSVANFICGLDSLLMIRSENPCLKKKVISSNVP